MRQNPFKAYEQATKNALSGRELEAAVLTKAAHKLQRCMDEWEKRENFREMIREALRYNQKIWTIFQSEISDTNHPLPKETKENLLKLSLFIDNRTFEILRRPERDKLKVLIDINHNIAAGLREKSKD